MARVLEASTKLLIDQWRAPRAPVLNAKIQIFLTAVQTFVLDAMDDMDRMRDLDEAEGVWLDRLGERIGMPRPSVVVQGEVFGFDSAGVGFDQARIRDEEPVQPQQPLGDALYRKLIRARGWTLLSYGNAEYFLRAVREIDPDATLTDNDDMTFTVTTGFDNDVKLADRVGALPRPAGVRMVVA